MLKSGRPDCGADLLRTPPPSIRPRAADIARHPWYESLAEELPIWTPPDRLAIRTAKLRRAMEAVNLELLDAGCRLAPASELNRSFEETDNKSRSVMLLVLDLLQHQVLHLSVSATLRSFQKPLRVHNQHNQRADV